MSVGDSSALRPPLPPFSARFLSTRPSLEPFHMSVVRSVSGDRENFSRSDGEHVTAVDDSLMDLLPPPPFTATPGIGPLPDASSVAHCLDSRQVQDLGFPHANPNSSYSMLRFDYGNSDLGLQPNPNSRHSEDRSATGSATPSLDQIAAQLKELQRSIVGMSSAATPHHHRRSQRRDRRSGESPLIAENHVVTLEHIASQINTLQRTAAGAVGRHRRSVSRGRRSRSRSGRTNSTHGGSSSGSLKSWSHVVQSGSDSPQTAQPHKSRCNSFPPQSLTRWGSH